MPNSGSLLLRRGAALGVLALVLGTTVACTDADAANKAEPPHKGGSLTIILSRSFVTHLDPQQINAGTDANISRLVTRTLTTYKSEPGQAASEIVGDLATDTGRPSENNTVWEFTLKPGVKWEDGSPVTCPQVKYGVERRFSSLYSNGLPYPVQYLKDNDPPYRGPFLDLGDKQGLRSVECVDQRTVRFHLKQPVGDFGYTVATPTFAPVPPGKDENKAGYDKRPFSNGPYKVESTSAKQITLIRNGFWDPGTDSVRKAYPDRIVIKSDPDTPAVTNALIQSQGDDKNSVVLDADVAPNFVQQVINDPDLSKRAIAGSFGGIRYFAINTRTIPNLNCRKALIYAFNKRKYRAAMGGSVFGDLATTMIAPDLKAHLDFDLYGTQANPEGDPDKAQQLMTQAKCRQKITVAVPDNATIKRYVNTIIEAYQRAGIQVVLKPIDPATYFDTGIGDPANSYDLMYAGWIPDWANGSAILPPLFDGRQIPDGHQGNKNYSLLDDKEINTLIDQALAEPDLDKQYVLWGQLDQKIQERAVTIPVIYMKALRMAGSGIRGGFIHPAYGQPDAVSLGVAP
ncbi:MAG TPA: ABC transporter substrate-binding protein [Micromonosporaceae bacterium]